MPRNFRALGREFGPASPLVIAEIGTGHGGELSKAFELIDAAAEAGADCAKFQCVLAREIIHPNTGFVPLPGGPVALFERFRSLELPEDFYAALKERTEKRGLVFLCTPFGLESAALLRRLGVSLLKAASPELNHLPLLKALAGSGLPVLLSSGVSTLADIERALGIIPPERACLLHCVTAYPAPAEDYNLRVLENLSRVLGVPVGVSDHSLDPVLVPVLALSQGAAAIEKHICLSRNDPGLDDPIALPPEDFRAMTRALAEAVEAGPQASVEALRRERGSDLVEAVLGDGVKRLAPSEAANYTRTNRSIHALRDIAAGETLREGMLALLRTEKVLRPGLAPELLPAVLGRRTRRDIPSGEGIVWEDLGDLT